MSDKGQCGAFPPSLPDWQLRIEFRREEIEKNWNLTRVNLGVQYV